MESDIRWHQRLSNYQKALSNLSEAVEPTNSLLNAIIEQAATIDDIAVIWLYGSQAKGTANENSDIDLAIAFNHFSLSALDRKVRPEEYALTWSAALDLPEAKISVVDINTIPVYLAFNVVEYGKVIVCKNKARELKETQRIYSQYEFETIERDIDRRAREQ